MKSPMDTIRWGMIGAGDVTEVKSGPPLYTTEHSELVAVMRRTAHLAEDYARRHHVPKWYSDAQALIDDPEINAIYIATPPSSHKDYTLKAAAAGKPVYVEKPMALKYAECRDMIDACQTAGVALYVAYYRRALPRFVQIKQWLDEGAIGDVRSVHVTLHQPSRLRERELDDLPWRVQPAVSGGGLFLDVGSHMLDFLDYALGPITSVKGHALNHEKLSAAEDHVSASFVFESGAMGVGDWCFAAFEPVDLTEIVGSEGKVSYATFSDAPVTLTTRSGTQQLPIPNPSHVQEALVQTIVAALRGVGTTPSTGESAARTTRVMDQILEAYRASGFTAQ